MSELKLLPCPFCGAEAELMIFNSEYGTVTVRCTNEDCDITMGKAFFTDEEAIEHWNRRQPMDNIVEKLEEIKNEDVCMETSCTECKEKYKNNFRKDCYEPIQKLVLDRAINIVKQEINKEN